MLLTNLTAVGIGYAMCAESLALPQLLTLPVETRVTLLFGGGGIVIGYLLTIVFLDSVLGLVIGATVIGASIGLAYGAMPTLIMGAVPHSESGSANSFNAVMRMFGLSGAATITGALLAASATEVGGVIAPSAEAVTEVLAIAAVVVGIGMILTWFLPRTPGTAA